MEEPSIFDEWKERSLLDVLKRRLRPDHPRPEQPDGPTVDDDALPICINCLAIQKQAAQFCPECGAPVGQYTNIMPYEYISGMGHGFRKCVEPGTKLSPLMTAGLILASIGQYHIFAPLYWYRLHRARNSTIEHDSTDPAGRTQEPARRSFGEDSYEERIKKYTTPDLLDIKERIKCDQFPERYAQIIFELKRRSAGNENTQ